MTLNQQHEIFNRAIQTAIAQLEQQNISFKVFQQQCNQSIKEYYSVISKLTKQYSQCQEMQTHLAHGLIDEAIQLHFVRQGRDLQLPIQSQQFQEEKSKLLNSFQALFELMDLIGSGNLARAIEWSLQHSMDELSLMLKKVQFLLILYGYTLSEQPVLDSIQYLKANLQDHPMLPKLITSVLFVDGHSPYEQLPFNTRNSLPPQVTVMLDRCKSMFSKSFCGHIGMPQESPLVTVLEVGMVNVPVMLKLDKVLSNDTASTEKVSEKRKWNTNDMLPIELPLEKKQRFHSVFACPVSREQTNDINPPMMLPCGHVLSLDSLERVSLKGRQGVLPEDFSMDQYQKMKEERDRDVFHGVNTQAKLKCPYCPQETQVGQTLRVYF